MAELTIVRGGSERVVRVEAGRTLWDALADSGFERFHPDEWDEKLGALIRLPEEKTT